MGPSGLLVETSTTTSKNNSDNLDVDMGDSAEEHVLDTTNIIVANKLLGNCQLQALTESSSSGSITESICTQYEPAAVVEEHTAVVVEEEGSRVQETDEDRPVGFKKSNSMFLEGFISASNMLKTLSTATKAADGIRLNKAEPFLFSSTNFQRADHRLQLYLHQNVFLESNEKFGSVVRGALVSAEIRKCEDAVVVQSNKVLYLFLVTSEEEEDDPGQWLKLMKRVDLKNWLAVRLLPFGVGVRFCFSGGATSDSWELMLKDGQHSRNYVAMVREQCGKRCDEDLCEEHKRKLMGVLGIELDGGDEEDGEELLFLGPFKGLTKIVSEVAQAVEQGSALLVTSRRFVILSPNWTWLATGRPGDVPEVKSALSLLDMVECEIKSETEFVLNFMDEKVNKHELWCLDWETKLQSQEALEAIKRPWEKAFNEPFVAK